MLTQKTSFHFRVQPFGFLFWEKESSREQREIKDFLSVGRGETNQLILEDPFVSRRHIRIERDKGERSFCFKGYG